MNSLFDNFDVDLSDFDKLIKITCGSSTRDIITNSSCHRVLERATEDPLVDSVDIYILQTEYSEEGKADHYIEKLRIRPSLISLIQFDFSMGPIDLTDNDLTYKNLVHYKQGVIKMSY